MPSHWMITIPLEPTGQMRPRSSVRAGHAFVHKDKKQASRERAIMACVAQSMPVTRFEGPLLMGVRAYLPLPKSKPKKWLEQARMGLIRPTVKPDLDNLIKQIKDCLTQMGVWEDDKNVVEYLPGTGKWYSANPRWEIEVRAWAGKAEQYRSAREVLG
jgi:Holliday junction resolvase RusA-like endonuclease